MADIDHGDHKAIRELLWKINLCGCGSIGPDAEWSIVRLVLERAEAREDEARRDQTPSLYDKADDAAGRWVEFAAKVVDGWGLIEHGGGIGYSWLTGTGGMLLSFLREHGTDRDEWPVWATSEDA